MKESVSNVLRWISLPFVLFGVFTLVHVIEMLLYSSSISSMSFDGGPLPILPNLLITLVVGAISAGVSIYACTAIAPSHKRTVVWVSGILLITICTAAVVYSAIVNGWEMDLLSSVVDTVGAILGTVSTMKSCFEKELS